MVGWFRGVDKTVANTTKHAGIHPVIFFTPQGHIQNAPPINPIVNTEEVLIQGKKNLQRILYSHHGENNGTFEWPQLRVPQVQHPRG